MSWELFVKNKLNEDIWGMSGPNQATQGAAVAPAAPAQKAPKEGDLAQVKVNGIGHIGKLANIQNNGREFVGQFILHGERPDPLTVSNMGTLLPMRNEPPVNVSNITWNDVHKIWNAVAK